MTAGLNHKGRVWRFQYTDDAQGGALPTGTVIYEPVFMRIWTEKPTLALLEQGLITPELFSAILEPGTINLHHNDQIEIIEPNISPLLGLKFVVVSIQIPSMLDERRYIRIVMRRFETANSNNLE